MRTFIAIELPQEIKAALGRLQEELKSSGSDVKWVEPQNIHLTLKFLGEIEDKKLQRIIKAMEETAAENTGFQINISSLGGFPKMDFLRVIWVGIDKGEKETVKIAEGLQERIAKIGIPKEARPFSSHITIGRTRSSLNRDKLVQFLKNKTGLERQGLGFCATKITLFKSTLTPKGPFYEALKEISLKAA